MREPLDTRFDQVRTQETAIGNFAADLMRKEHCADVAVFMGGGIRADKVYPSGFLKYEAYSEMFPFPNPVMLLESTGEQILSALENGVSKVPALDGRFPQVSGIKFTFDPNKPPMQRILLDTVKLEDSPIDLKKKYRFAVPKYMAAGKDGYDMLINCRKIVDLIVAPIFKDIFDEFVNFVQIKRTLEEYKLWKKHQDSFVKGKLLDVSLQNRLQEEANARLLSKEGSKKQRLFFKPLKNRRRSEGQIQMREMSIDFAIGIHSHHKKNLFGNDDQQNPDGTQSQGDSGIQEFILKPATSTFGADTSANPAQASSFQTSGEGSDTISESLAKKHSSNPSTGMAGSSNNHLKETDMVIKESDSEDDEDSSKPSTRYFKIEEVVAEASQEQIREGHAVLGTVLLKRLRKYRLIDDIIENLEAKHSQTKYLAILDLKTEGRVTSIPLAVPETQH